MQFLSYTGTELSRNYFICKSGASDGLPAWPLGVTFLCEFYFLQILREMLLNIKASFFMSKQGALAPSQVGQALKAELWTEFVLMTTAQVQQLVAQYLRGFSCLSF